MDTPASSPSWASEPAWTPEEGAQRATDFFRASYQAEPAGVWSSPGRVNIIGEHTDYNGGLCLPIALPHRTYVAVSPRDDSQVRLTTTMGTESARWEGTLSDIAPGAVTDWPAYAAGIAWVLAQHGHRVQGFDAAIDSCVPLSAGLSSSAAVECAMALALDELNHLGLADTDRPTLVRYAVEAENKVAMAPTGGLDQSASLRSSEGQALLLDCLDDSTRQIPFDIASQGLELLVIDTRATHALGDGQYGQRRSNCEQAAQILGVDYLRQIDDLDAALAKLPDDLLRRRTKHVVTEIARVREFVQLIEAGRYREVGPVMNASHASLRDDYEVSCTELDIAVATCQAHGAIGARMTGGGFGGCAIALIDTELYPTITRAVVDAYSAEGLAMPKIHSVTPARGGERVR